MTAHRHHPCAPLDIGLPSTPDYNIGLLTHDSFSMTMTPPRIDIPAGARTATTNCTTPPGRRINMPTTNPDLDFNIGFRETPAFCSTSSSSTPSPPRSFVGSLGSSSGGGRLSSNDRMEGDETKSRVTRTKGKARRVKTEPVLGFHSTLPTSCEGGSSGGCSSTWRMKPKPSRGRNTRKSDEGNDSRSMDVSWSGSESDQTTSPNMRLRSNFGSMMKMVHPFGFVEQRH
ncbi:hypothetical protein EDC04DRAFT_1262430 [Pisolithus marmoratus]|nr:hypothetical protein EDC04DRAFT_1262430 [Pisolithus marmoratus]